MRNKMDLLGGMFNGLNLNPIPLEFSQSMSTTKTIAALLAKLDQVITFTNEWYDKILDDLEGEGALYAKLNEQFLTTFANDINTINTSLLNVINSVTALEYVKPTMIITPSCNLKNLIGSVLNSVIVSSVVTGVNITKIEFYVNDVLFSTVANPNNPYITLNNISTNTKIVAKVYDAKGVIDSNILNIIFVNPKWKGVNATNVITDTIVTHGDMFDNSSLSFTEGYSFICCDSDIELFYNDVNVNDCYNKSTITINSVVYNLYVSKNYITENIQIEVK